MSNLSTLLIQWSTYLYLKISGNLLTITCQEKKKESENGLAIKLNRGTNVELRFCNVEIP